jgi:hypothetical protein
MSANHVLRHAGKATTAAAAAAAATAAATREQEDAQEFLNFLLDSAHQELLRLRSLHESALGEAAGAADDFKTCSLHVCVHAIGCAFVCKTAGSRCASSCCPDPCSARLSHATTQPAFCKLQTYKMELGTSRKIAESCNFTNEPNADWNLIKQTSCDKRSLLCLSRADEAGIQVQRPPGMDQKQTYK